MIAIFENVRHRSWERYLTVKFRCRSDTWDSMQSSTAWWLRNMRPLAQESSDTQIWTLFSATTIKMSHQCWFPDRGVLHVNRLMTIHILMNSPRTSAMIFLVSSSAITKKLSEVRKPIFALWSNSIRIVLAPLMLPNHVNRPVWLWWGVWNSGSILVP